VQSPNPPRPPYPPRPGSSPGESDRNLVAQLGDKGAGTRAVALLLARHWQAAYDYAVICLASAESSASMAATAAFHQVLGHRAAIGALRPQLLMAVRDTVKEWAAEGGISVLLPELRKTTGGRGLRAARSATPERRQLAERAFRALPGASQCLLWHTEVEAEPITVPAGLLGVDTDTAAAALEQAREQFRAGCVRAHRELAPTAECRFYNRLLDVPIRRGGALLPDVRRHLMECRYCRFAAEQLSHFEGGLEVLLAETVLGWGALRYLDSRPGRAAPESLGRAGPGHPGRRPGGGGRHRPAPDGLLAFPRRHPKAVLAGVGLTSLVLLATVLVAKGWSEDGGSPGPQATWGAPSGNSVRPGGAGVPSSAGSPSAAGAGYPAVIEQGRLRSLTSGLCLDVRGGRAETGAGAELAACSSAGTQRWSYDQDGLLRSAADPLLCLDADPGVDRVSLAGCLVHSGDVHYDLTVRGELVLRWSQGLTVAPSAGKAGARVAVADRDGSVAQRWVLDSVTDAQGEKADPKEKGETEENGKQVKGGGDEAGEAKSQEPGGGGLENRAPQPPGTGTPQQGDQEYQPRMAQVACCGAPEPARPTDPADAVRPLSAVTDIVDTVTTQVGATLTTVLH
jgi:hypothetical protein